MKKFILSICVALFAFTSCADFFETTANDMLVNDEHYTSKSNVYSAYAGLLTTLQNVAAKNIVISDLLSDVITPTAGAPDDYWDIFNYAVTSDNEVASPAEFYNVVMNANDFLRKTVEYNASYPGHLDELYYSQLIASGVATRAWAYLQIGKIYGEAAYYDYIMSSDEVDLSTIPLLSFDELIDELIYFMQTGVDDISGISRVDIVEIFDVSGEHWRTLCISADALMMELYMWRGDYTSAAVQGIYAISGRGLYSFTDEDWYTCSDLYSKGDWSDLFSLTPVAAFRKEAFTFVMFDSAKNQENELHSLFSATSPNVYYLKPTDRLLEMFSTSSSYGIEDKRYSQYDYRGYGVTYAIEMGETVMKKYHCAGRSAYDRDASIFLYRASEIHLMLAEALVRLGQYDAADILLNDGMSTCYVSGTGSAATFNQPFDAPIFKMSYLKGGLGVRGRVNAPVIRHTDSFFYDGVDTLDAVAYDARREFVLDSLISAETALELTGEGKRWFSLMRTARNTNNPSFLIEQVIKKFPEEEQMRYRVLLSDQDNWFIKYDLGLTSEDESDSE